jgi:hypothetical protein
VPVDHNCCVTPESRLLHGVSRFLPVKKNLAYALMRERGELSECFQGPALSAIRGFENDRGSLHREMRR